MEFWDINSRELLNYLYRFLFSQNFSQLCFYDCTDLNIQQLFFISYHKLTCHVMLNLAHICGIDFPFNKEVHSDWSRIILFNNIRCMENDIVL